MPRSFLIVIDSFGCGALPDAADYGDVGSNTGLHICEAVGGAHWPNLTRWGLGNAVSLLEQTWPGVSATETPRAAFGVMAEASPGKDTTTGHWEIAGVVLDKPLHVFPQSGRAFPEFLLEAVRTEYACGILGDVAASGTEIIARLGDEHRASGDPIFYTSADPVVQIAAHEDIWPVDRLYELCRFVRRLVDPLRVGRVIARPFAGDSGAYQRTPRRKDFSIEVPGVTLMDKLRSEGVTTISVGKVGNVFNDSGFDQMYPDKGNPACLERVEALINDPDLSDAFIFENLVDTDEKFGHRRDPEGYHDAVARIDDALGKFEALCRPDDSIIITADHGCDPTFKGTDHTREYVPLLAFGGSFDGSLGIQTSLAYAGNLAARCHRVQSAVSLDDL